MQSPPQQETTQNGSKSMETVNASLEHIIGRVDGLYGVVVSDLQGAVYSRVMRQDSPSYLPLYPVQLQIVDPTQSSRAVLVPATDPGSVLFAATIERGAKIGCGNVKTVTAVYDNYIVIYSRYNPLIITFVAAAGANRALLYTIIPELENKLDELKRLIAENQINAQIMNNAH